MECPLIELRKVSKFFPGVIALNKADLKLYSGEVHGLMGENGAGKSTLIKLLTGAYKPDEGEMLLDGQPLKVNGPKDAMNMGLTAIYQELNVIPKLTVWENIFLGNDVIINMNCTFVDNKTIRIGDRVLIASNVQIYTSSHPVLPQERFVPDWRERQTTFFRTYARPIEIESNVWIGGGCILLPGVTIGKNSVIGAGSVVTRPIPPNCVAVGNPCRVIRYFDTDRERWQHEV